MFAAQAVPNFRRHVGGQALSPIGTWVETVAQALLVLRLTIGSPVIGALSDASSPRSGLLLGAVACVAAAAIGRWPARAGHGASCGPGAPESAEPAGPAGG